MRVDSQCGPPAPGRFSAPLGSVHYGDVLLWLFLFTCPVNTRYSTIVRLDKGPGLDGAHTGTQWQTLQRNWVSVHLAWQVRRLLLLLVRVTFALCGLDFVRDQFLVCNLRCSKCSTARPMMCRASTQARDYDDAINAAQSISVSTRTAQGDGWCQLGRAVGWQTGCPMGPKQTQNRVASSLPLECTPVPAVQQDESNKYWSSKGSC